MGMETVSMDRRGRVTIPKVARERLGTTAEDRLVVTVDAGEVRLRPSFSTSPSSAGGAAGAGKRSRAQGEALFARDE